MEMHINTMDNSGTLVNEPTVHAENVAMGNFTQNFYPEKETNPTFSTIDFDHEEIYPDPTFTSTVFDLVLQKRILIIKGNDQFDQYSFGRLIAKKIYEFNSNLQTIELIQNEEDKSLNKQLLQQETGCIILLNGLHPRHIQYDFNDLIRICEEKQSYYIINTESSSNTWIKSGKAITDYWYDIPSGNYYNRPELTQWFIDRLTDKPLEFISYDKEITPQTLFSETITLSHIISELNTPQKLTIFLNMSRNSTVLFSDKKLIRIVENLRQSQEEIIAKWFNNLNSDHKIIALTTALFNGLYCAQYFEILTEMIKTSFWRQSEATLEALDYHNLDFLMAFFRFEGTDEGDLIVARNPTTRVNLLKTAMHQYPRHIEKALIIFSHIMQKSYERKNLNWELHGTGQKRALLRQVFIEATRDIGVNSLGNIEQIYLELAASNHHYIQGIAAKSLAQYRLFEEDDLLFDTINKWLKDNSIKQRMDLFLVDKTKLHEDTISAIKTTTIRTLAYAADYDQPNQLHQRIVEYLISFSTDYSEKVQLAISQVLPKFITHHAFQLRNEIFDFLMPNSNYSEAISTGLMQAYTSYPEKLKEVINHWLSICMKDESKENRREKTTFRDNALISILDTLQKIKVSENGFTLNELYALASNLLQIEKRSAVLNAVLQFMASIHEQDYTLAFDYIPKTIGQFNRHQRKEMIRLWTYQFIRQRANITDGEFKIVVFGEEYQAWNSFFKRPLTPIEETLFVWLNSDSKIAQRFATHTFLEISHLFEREELKQIKLHRAQQEELRIRLQKQKIANSQPKNIQQVAFNPGLGLWLRIKIFFYLLFEEKKNKQSLKEIIHLFLAERYSKMDLQMVVYKWQTRKKGNFSDKLAKWLEKLMRNI